MRISSLNRLPHSFHAAGTNGRLDLSAHPAAQPTVRAVHGRDHA